MLGQWDRRAPMENYSSYDRTQIQTYSNPLESPMAFSSYSSSPHKPSVPSTSSLDPLLPQMPLSSPYTTSSQRALPHTHVHPTGEMIDKYASHSRASMYEADDLKRANDVLEERRWSSSSQLTHTMNSNRNVAAEETGKVWERFEKYLESTSPNVELGESDLDPKVPHNTFILNVLQMIMFMAVCCLPCLSVFDSR